MIYYGLSFAYLVGLLIVSHILKSPELFPYWNLLLIWSVLGMVDANLPSLSFGYVDRPWFQYNEAAAVRFVWLSVVVSGIVYAYFVTDVILDVCDYCQISWVFCFPPFSRSLWIGERELEWKEEDVDLASSSPARSLTDCLTIKQKESPRLGVAKESPSQKNKLFKSRWGSGCRR